MSANGLDTTEDLGGVLGAPGELSVSVVLVDASEPEPARVVVVNDGDLGPKASLYRHQSGQSTKFGLSKHREK